MALNRIEAMEGFEVAIAILLEKMSICELFAGIYVEVRLPLQSMTHSLQLQNILDSALPEFYGSVIVFAVKARAYFEAKGMYTIYGV